MRFDLDAAHIAKLIDEVCRCLRVMSSGDRARAKVEDIVDHGIREQELQRSDISNFDEVSDDVCMRDSVKMNARIGCYCHSHAVARSRCRTTSFRAASMIGRARACVCA
jgi:hypothetical protein